jgi:hypothetical protein
VAFDVSTFGGALMIPLITFGATCLSYWATKILTRGVMFALAVAALEVLFLMLLQSTSGVSLDLIAYSGYTVGLAIFGILALVNPDIISDRLGNSYPLFVVGNALLVIYSTLVVIQLSVPLIDGLPTVAAILFVIVLALRRGKDLVHWIQDIRKTVREMYGQQPEQQRTVRPDFGQPATPQPPQITTPEHSGLESYVHNLHCRMTEEQNRLIHGHTTSLPLHYGLPRHATDCDCTCHARQSYRVSQP